MQLQVNETSRLPCARRTKDLIAPHLVSHVLRSQSPFTVVQRPPVSLGQSCTEDSIDAGGCSSELGVGAR